MRSLIVVSLVFTLLVGASWGSPLPNAPTPQKSVEHDPGAWAFTTGFSSALVGTFTKPSIGLGVGVGIAVLGNLQNSNNAHQNMAGGIAGAVGGYLLIKTLKRDWHSKKK